MTTDVLEKRTLQKKNEKGAMVESVESISAQIYDENNNAIGSMAVGVNYGSFSVNSPVFDVEKLYVSLEKLITDVK